MSKDCKTIFDPIHGSIRIGGVYLEILNRHEMQRLRGVKQLDMGYMVYPGANHTRFEHSLGVYHLAGRMADSLGLSEEDRSAVMAAGLLHDVCHPPFSHTLEELTFECTGLDHMDMARELIFGRMRTYRERDGDMFGGCPPISELLDSAGISSGKVCDLITQPETEDSMGFMGGSSFFPSEDYIHQIIHGPVDADQMDYLMRDAHYTGVTWGSIDTERILGTMRVHNDRIVMERGGVVAAEGLMVARALMYSAVYYHATVRVIRMMLTKAVECSGLDVSETYTWNDADLTSALISSGGKASEITRSILARRIYGTAYMLYSEDADSEIAGRLAEFSGYRKRKELEFEIADKAGSDPAELIVDMPSRSTMLSKSRIGKTDVSIIDPVGRVRSITRFSTIAKGLQSRDPFGWKLLVACPKKDMEKVGKAARSVLSL